MNKLTHSSFFRVVAVALITSFISLDVSWAYPPDSAARNSMLGAPSAFQQQPVNDHAARFQQSIFSEGKLLGSVCSIAKYLLEDSLPIKHLEEVMSAELGRAVESIDLLGVEVKDGAVIIPRKIGGPRIQIALRANLNANELIGYEWLISDKYVIKELPEDYDAMVAQVAEQTVLKSAADQIVDLMAKRDDLPQEADLLVVFGSGNARVASEAAKLYHSRKISRVMVAGKYGPHIIPNADNPDFGKDKDGVIFEAEALVYKRILMQNGVPEGAILVEKESQGMTDNGVNSVKLLNQRGLIPNTVIFMHAPLLQLRGSLSLRNALDNAEIKAKVYDYAAPLTIDPDKDAAAIVWQSGRLTDDVVPIIGQEKLAKIKGLLETLKAEREARPAEGPKVSISELIPHVEASITKAGLAHSWPQGVTSGFTWEIFETLSEGVEYLAKLGLSTEVGLNGERDGVDVISEEEIDRIREISERYGVSLTMHAPYSGLRICTLDDEARERSIAQVKKAIQIAARMGITVVTVHQWPMTAADVKDREKIWQRTIDTFKDLVEFGNRYGVSIAAENSYPYATYHAGFTTDPSVSYEILTTPEDMARLLSAVPGLKTNLDVAHANWSTGAVEFLEGLARLIDIPTQLAEIHLSDNLRSREGSEHAAFGEGDIDFTKIFGILEESGFKGHLVAENYSNNKKNQCSKEELTAGVAKLNGYIKQNHAPFEVDEAIKALSEDEASAVVSNFEANKTKVCFIGVGSPNHYNMWNNLSLETLAGDLKGAFGDTVAVSMLWTNNSDEIDSIVKKAMDDGPGIIGISIQPGSMEIVELLVKRLNSEQAVNEGKIMVVFGNQIPTYIPEKFIEMCPQGIVIRGEGEIAMRMLVDVARGSLKLSEVPSAVYKDRVSGVIVHTEIIPPRLDSLYYPPTTDTYEEIASRGGNVQVQASRGCPWGGCAYCTRTSFRKGGMVAGIKEKTASWEGFTVDRVIRTLDEVMSRGITEVEFSDDEFIGGRKDENIQRILKIADGIIALKKKHGIPDFSFRIFTRPSIIFNEGDVDNKNEAIKQLILKLKQAGLVRVFIGVEAGNQAQIKRYTRGMRLSAAVEAIRILQSVGIGVDSGFIMFDPELTIEEMLENVRYFRDNGLITSNQWPFRPMIINHGSKMVERLRKKGLLGGENANFMSHEYSAKDPSIENIAQIVDEISKKTRTIFYALKVKSKIFDPKKQDDGVRLCQRYVEDNGLIYLDLMEALGTAMQRGAAETEIDAISERADERVIELAKQVADDIARGKINDEDDYLKKELAKIGIKDNVAGLSFRPSREIIQGKPLDESFVVPLGASEAAIELLKNARDKGIELSITGHLRGFDGAGSSLDLPEFQRALTAIGATDLRDLPSTPTIASEFTVKVRFELADDPEVIEYVAPDYGITESNPYILKGKVNLTPAGRTPNGQKDAPAFILRNIFALKGIRVVCESISPMALAGGMESSNVFNASLIAAGSMLSGAGLSMAEIFSLSVKLENDEFGGLTGGQGHLCWMLGGAYRHVWLSGIKDANGLYVNPYAALSLPLLTQDDLAAMEDHMMIGQAGKQYVDGKAQMGRTAALVNFMWTDLLRDEDVVGLPLHKEKMELADRYVRAIMDKDFAAVVNIMNRYVDMRDQLCKRWTNLMLDAHQGKSAPQYAKAYADKVFNPDNKAYADYETLRKMYDESGEGLRDISLYAPGPIAEIVAAGRKEGMTVMPLGAGGPGANIIAISPQGIEHIKRFFESQGLGLLTEDGVRKIVRGTGTLKGYMPFKAGRDPVKFNGFEACGMKIPAPPAAVQYNQWTGKSTPMASAKSSLKTEPVSFSDATGAIALDDIVESSVNNHRANFIASGNKILATAASDAGPEAAAILGAVDKKMSTAEIRQRIERAMTIINVFGKDEASLETLADIDSLKKDMCQFEADGAVGSLIVLARKAKRENQKLIIGLETDWIPGIDEIGYGSQHDAINLLLGEIRSIGQTLKDLGLDNVEIVEGAGKGLAVSLLDKADNTKTNLSNVIVLASSATINDVSFDPLRSTATEKRAFLAGIDASEITQFYEANKEYMKTANKQLQIRIMAMLSMTLELAAGKEPPQSPIIVSYDRNLRVLMLLPKADLKNYNELKSDYAAEKTALAAA